jgi:lantibiotic modifying enzyme
VPGSISDVINSLWKGCPEAAKNTLDDAALWLSDTRPGNSSVSADAVKLTEDRIDSILRQTASHILATADYERNDRLWPAHYAVFMTNPLNVSYGACGIVLYLLETIDRQPESIWRWLEARAVDHHTYPPGLLFGLAGIAFTFHKMGKQEAAEQVMKRLYQSPLLYEEPGLALGAAGWGLMSLYFYIQTRSESYLRKALEAGEYLLKSAHRNDNNNCFWRGNYDQRVHYGYGYGASGIGLFLLYLNVASGRKDFLDAAVAALEHDLEYKIESDVGYQWKRFEGDSLLYPYWIHGNAGIGSIVLRFYKILKLEKYKALAERIAEDTYIKYSFIPGLYEGLAGIGEFMLDAYCIVEDQKYYQYALDIAETLIWFGIPKADGIAFPGRWLTRVSHDYATGAAGIGLFLSRIKNKAPRYFVDLDVEALEQLKYSLRPAQIFS